MSSVIFVISSCSHLSSFYQDCNKDFGYYAWSHITTSSMRLLAYARQINNLTINYCKVFAYICISAIWKQFWNIWSTIWASSKPLWIPGLYRTNQLCNSSLGLDINTCLVIGERHTAYKYKHKLQRQLQKLATVS